MRVLSALALAAATAVASVVARISGRARPRRPPVQPCGEIFFAFAFASSRLRGSI